MLACLQGVRIGAGKTPLTPADLRGLLRTTAGAAQQDGPLDPATGTVLRPASERIGDLPDLTALIPAALSLP